MMIRSLSRPVTNSSPSLQKAQVAGAQEGAFAGVCQMGAERLLGFLGPVPIALGHAGPGDPDLADLVGRDAASACRGSTITNC